MANIATNEFLFKATSNQKEWREKIDKFFKEDFYGDITYDSYDDEEEGDLIMEGYFESKWNFPEVKFQELIPEDTPEVYFRCLTQEPGFELYSMAVYKDEHWLDLQIFDV